MQTIINKFPEELVNAWCEVFFLPLFQRLTSDPSSQCREAVGQCLTALMLRANPEPLDKLVQYCLIWLGGGDARLARTAAQVRGHTYIHLIQLTSPEICTIQGPAKTHLVRFAVYTVYYTASKLTSLCAFLRH